MIMRIPKHLQNSAKTRLETVFIQGSPLKQKYTTLSCENCEILCEEAVADNYE